MALNRKNYLRWTGAFTPLPWSITANTLNATMYANQDYIDINVPTPASWVASNSTNSYSFRIVDVLGLIGITVVGHAELQGISQWDGVSILRIYRPVDLTLNYLKVQYKFSDALGNEITTTPFIFITIDTISIEWAINPGSATCTLDSFGDNTGYISFSQLVMQNALTHTAIFPLQLKDNNPADPDYIAPYTDHISCPLLYGSGDYSPLIISNFTQNNADPNPYDTITITNLYLYNATAGPGSTPVALNINCNIPAGNSQRFNILSGIPWDISITYSVTIGGNMVAATLAGFGRFWKSQSAGSVDDFPTGAPRDVINTSPYYVAAGVTLPFPLGITIFAQ